jgi:hypothetical protein
MPARILHKLRWPLAAAAGAALTLAATALAGSGVGGVFNLGVENMVNASTQLVGNTPDPQLQVINSANAAAIRGDSNPGIGVKGSSASGTGVNGSSNGGAGVIGIHASATGSNPGVSGQTNSTDPSSAGVIGRNTGVGPGVSAIVSSQAVPPLKVNSTARIPFLNADYVDGRHANGLLRLSAATAKDVGPPNLPSTLRTVNISAPTSGYVLLIGSAVASTDSPACNPCLLWLQFRDPTQSGEASISSAQVTSVGNGTTAFNLASVTTTWVVPVASGPHSFVLEGITVPSDPPFVVRNATATALFIPFNGSGNSP